MTEQEIWDKALSTIEKEISSDISFNTYIKTTHPVSFENGVFKIASENGLKQRIITSRYKNLISRCISGVAGRMVTLEITVDTPVGNGRSETDEETAPEIESAVNPRFSSSLNPDHTFENYVVGSRQDYAYAAAVNAARNPGINYNPLFLYGRSGLGKTHLMQAIGNEILRIDPTKKVLYVTSEKFNNDLINSIRDKNTEAFRQLYRDVDALLIDDVQFIQGKSNVQEEFFHTFNELHSKRKQIVITSDRKPKELIVLEERIRNRFEWGLIQDIMLPDFETRVAILKKKLQLQNQQANSANEVVHISDEVLEYIAQQVNTTIRELEGALVKITAYAGMSGKKIDLPLAEQVLRDILPEDIKITSKTIIEKVSTYYKVTEKDILGTSRSKSIVFPRQIAMYLCKTLVDMNYTNIGHDFGNKDRTTVMHNVDKIKEMLDTDEKLRADIESIKTDLHSLSF